MDRMRHSWKIQIYFKIIEATDTIKYWLEDLNHSQRTYSINKIK